MSPSRLHHPLHNLQKDIDAGTIASSSISMASFKLFLTETSLMSCGIMRKNKQIKIEVKNLNFEKTFCSHIGQTPRCFKNFLLKLIVLSNSETDI